MAGQIKVMSRALRQLDCNSNLLERLQAWEMLFIVARFLSRSTCLNSCAVSKACEHEDQTAEALI